MIMVSLYVGLAVIGVGIGLGLARDTLQRNVEVHHKPGYLPPGEDSPLDVRNSSIQTERKGKFGGNFIVEVVTIEKTFVGEGPHWDGDKQELVYVDILGKGVLRYVPRTGEQYRLNITDKGEGEDSVNFIIPVKGQPNKYIIALGRSLRVLEWNGQSGTQTTPTKTLNLVNDGNQDGRFNDGKCDAAGRIWAGTLKLDDTSFKGAFVYRLGLNGHLTRRISGVSVSNGLTWSPDNKVFYYIDSALHNVIAYDYDLRTGTIRRPRVVFDLKANGIEGVADGMTVDINGNLWIANYGGYKVLHVDPRSGALLNVIKFPASKITSCTFGGPNLDILYITSTSKQLTPEQLAKEPLAGALFQVRNTGTRGVSDGVPYGGPV